MHLKKKLTSSRNLTFTREREKSDNYFQYLFHSNDSLRFKGSSDQRKPLFPMNRENCSTNKTMMVKKMIVRINREPDQGGDLMRILIFRIAIMIIGSSDDHPQDFDIRLGIHIFHVTCK